LVGVPSQQHGGGWLVILGPITGTPNSSSTWTDGTNVFTPTSGVPASDPKQLKVTDTRVTQATIGLPNGAASTHYVSSNHSCFLSDKGVAFTTPSSTEFAVAITNIDLTLFAPQSFKSNDGEFFFYGNGNDNEIWWIDPTYLGMNIQSPSGYFAIQSNALLTTTHVGGIFNVIDPTSLASITTLDITGAIIAQVGLTAPPQDFYSDLNGGRTASDPFTAMIYSEVNRAVAVTYGQVDGQTGSSIYLVTGLIPIPVLNVAPLSLVFSAPFAGPNPSSQTVSVTNAGPGSLNYTALSNALWLSVSPASGVAPNTLTISVDQTGLAAGVYIGFVVVTGTTANTANTPLAVLVTFTVVAAPIGILGGFVGVLQGIGIGYIPNTDLWNYLEGPPSYGSILFDLVGFGSAQPYWTNATGRHLAQLHYKAEADPTGLVSIPLVGNDQIVPAGTSYQVTILSPSRSFVSQGRFTFTGLLFNFNTATPVQPL
jgi:Viral BACON domain